MKLRSVRVMCIVALLFIGMHAANAQVYHQLSPVDFQGVAPNGNYIAYTNCIIDYTYQPVYINGYYKLKINVNVQVNKNRSWIDKSRVNTPEMLAEVMKHEQGHYIFAYLMQQEMTQAGNTMRFGANYDQQISTVLNKIKNKYKQLNDDYDDDTSHMVNRKQQNAWDLFFKQQVGPQYNNLAVLSQAR